MKRTLLNICVTMATVVALSIGFAHQSFGQESGTYEVKPGDTLYSISRTFDISIEELRQLNDLEDGVIRAGMILKVKPDPVAPESFSATPIRISAGYSIDVLADELGISESELRLLNPQLEEAVADLNNLAEAPSLIPSRYVVKPGDTLYGIARANGLSVSALTEMNSLSGSGLQPGQSLQVGASLPEGTTQWVSQGQFEIGVYPEQFEGRMLQSGLTYSSSSVVVSHPSLDVGTVVLLKAGDEELLCIVADLSLSLTPSVMDVSAFVSEVIGDAREVEVFMLK